MAASTKTAQIAIETRREHLQILLGRLTGHADIIRQHLKERPHAHTLGFAAEAGVRDVLRQVLPRRLAVTSGFIRSTTGKLLVPPTSGDVSPQTDILIYDTQRACPLYSVEGIDVVAAPDVLGVLEIKDSTSGEADLGLTADGFEKRKQKYEADVAARKSPKPVTSQDDGALEHIMELAGAAPSAFRGIVLIQGDDASLARSRLSFAKDHKKLSPANAPHVIYGRGLAKKNGGSSYIAFLNSSDGALHFNPYPESDTDSLAAFLRLVTGFFAAQGLTSTSIAADLGPSGPRAEKSPEPLPLAEGGEVPSLRATVRAAATERGEGEEGQPSDEAMLKSFFDDKKTELKIDVFPAIGHDSKKIPTSGPRVVVSYKDGAETRKLTSFFTMSTAGFLRCVDDGGGESGEPPWRIHRESVDVYLMRVCDLGASVFIQDEEAETEPGLPAPRPPADEPEAAAIAEVPAEDLA